MSDNNKKLSVMRGIPGSGKSTHLWKTAPNAAVCSADFFFIGSDGKYVFDASKLKGAHDSCFRRFNLFIAEGIDHVAVDNTNLTWWEAGRYIEAGLAAGYEVELIDVRTLPETAAARNVHGVPAEHIQKMARKMLEIPKTVKDNPNFKYTLVQT